MFKISLTPTYKTPVTVETPNEAGGIDISKFNVIFNRYEVEDLEGPDGKSGMRLLPQPDVLRKGVAGWEKVVSDGGDVFEFSPENLEIMMKIPQALQSMSQTFWATQYGAKQKN